MSIAMNVGFIGLGGMGKAMAANLIRAGHPVRVWNRSRSAVEELVSLGAIGEETPQGAFRGDVVISMLADDVATREVILGNDLLRTVPQGIIHINMATISVALSKELTELHTRHGIPYIAAPVFGRTEVAAAGKLNIVAAGEPQALARVQPLLDVLGQKTWPAGQEPYRANVIKLAGNFMLACAIESMAESVALAQGHGVPATELLEILTNTLFAAPAYQTYGHLIAQKKFEPAAFKLSLGLKDVRLAQAAGEERGVPMPFASLLRDSFIDAIAHGEGNLDWSALAKVAQRRAGQGS